MVFGPDPDACASGLIAMIDRSVGTLALVSNAVRFVETILLLFALIVYSALHHYIFPHNGTISFVYGSMAVHLIHSLLPVIFINTGHFHALTAPKSH